MRSQKFGISYVDPIAKQMKLTNEDKKRVDARKDKYKTELKPEEIPTGFFSFFSCYKNLFCLNMHFNFFNVNVNF